MSFIAVHLFNILLHNLKAGNVWINLKPVRNVDNSKLITYIICHIVNAAGIYLPRCYLVDKQL